MPKKIVILNGSPRKNGNTASLTAAFKRGAEEAGHTVTEFFPAHMKINGCLGCWNGGKDAAHPCVQRDDMEKIYPLYKEADVVVLASKINRADHGGGRRRIPGKRILVRPSGTPHRMEKHRKGIMRLCSAARGRERETGTCRSI